MVSEAGRPSGHVEEIDRWPRGTEYFVTAALAILLLALLSVCTFLDVGFAGRLLFPKVELLAEGGELDEARKYGYEVMMQCSEDMFTVAQVAVGFHVAVWVYASATHMFRRRYLVAGLCGVVATVFAILSIGGRVLYSLHVAAWMAQAERLGGIVPSPESYQVSLFFRVQSLFVLFAVLFIVVEVANIVWIRMRVRGA